MKEESYNEMLDRAKEEQSQRERKPFVNQLLNEVIRSIER